MLTPRLSSAAGREPGREQQPYGPDNSNAWKTGRRPVNRATPSLGIGRSHRFVDSSGGSEERNNHSDERKLEGRADKIV